MPGPYFWGFWAIGGVLEVLSSSYLKGNQDQKYGDPILLEELMKISQAYCLPLNLLF